MYNSIYNVPFTLSKASTDDIIKHAEDNSKLLIELNGIVQANSYLLVDKPFEGILTHKRLELDYNIEEQSEYIHAYGKKFFTREFFIEDLNEHLTNNDVATMHMGVSYDYIYNAININKPPDVTDAKIRESVTRIIPEDKFNETTSRREVLSACKIRGTIGSNDYFYNIMYRFKNKGICMCNKILNMIQYMFLLFNILLSLMIILMLLGVLYLVVLWGLDPSTYNPHNMFNIPVLFNNPTTAFCLNVFVYFIAATVIINIVRFVAGKIFDIIKRIYYTKYYNKCYKSICKKNYNETDTM